MTRSNPSPSSTDQDLEPWVSIDSLVDNLNGDANVKTWTHWMIRYHLKSRDTNGLNQYTVKLGNKVLVSQPGFNKWIADHRSIGAK